jgi:hypothetical protein
LTNQLLAQADALWQEAEARVAAEPDLLRRVKLSRMSADYAIVERARAEAGKGPNGDKEALALAKARFQPFIETLGSSGLTNLREGSRLNLEEYRSKLAAALGVQP